MYNVTMPTRTRRPVPEAQMIAMNAQDSELPGLCQQGNVYACDLAQIPRPTAQEEADMARRRDEQAQAEREGIARKLENVGVNPAIAEAVRTNQPVIYAKDKQEAEEIVRENFPPRQAQEILDVFIHRRRVQEQLDTIFDDLVIPPWYKQTPVLIAGGIAVATLLGVFVYLRLT